MEKYNIPIYFIRHAEGEHQINNKLLNFIFNKKNPNLTKKGIEQCLQFNKSNDIIDDNTLILCSPFKRCIQTCEHITNKNFYIVKSFREISNHILPEDSLENEYIIPFFSKNNININLFINNINNNNTENYNKIVIITHANFIKKITNNSKTIVKNLDIKQF